MILLLPAAGRATRLPELNGQSKEALAIVPGRHAADALLEAAERAGASRACWLLRAGKEDITSCYGSRFGRMPLTYYCLPDTPSTLHTLRRALDTPELALGTETVALGFPDIQFRAPQAFDALAAALDVEDADLALGCFETDRADKVDVIERAGNTRVTGVHIKSVDAPGNTAWVLALWRPSFSAFLSAQPWPAAPQTRATERYIGHEIQAAIDVGMHVTSVVFEGGLLDLGTPEDLARAADFWHTD